MRNRRKTIRLNESELKSIVKESVKNIISEKKDKESLRNGTEDDYIKKLYYNQLKCLSRAGYYLFGNENFPYRINEHMKIYGEEFSTYPDIEENIATAFKTLGFYKSYKKYLKANRLALKIADLFWSIGQDIKGDYPRKNEDGFYDEPYYGGGDEDRDEQQDLSGLPGWGG